MKDDLGKSELTVETDRRANCGLTSKEPAMPRRKIFAIAFLTAGAGVAALTAVPASAAGGCSSNCSASTNVTFTLGASSGLSVSVPSNSDVDLGSATSNVLGTTVSGSLHPTTVTDTRGSLLAAWTVTVSTSGFDGSGGAAGQTIPANRATMYLDAVALLSDAVALATGGLLPTTVTTQ